LLYTAVSFILTLALRCLQRYRAITPPGLREFASCVLTLYANALANRIPNPHWDFDHTNTGDAMACRVKCYANKCKSAL